MYGIQLTDRPKVDRMKSKRGLFLPRLSVCAVWKYTICRATADLSLDNSAASIAVAFDATDTPRAKRPEVLSPIMNSY